ncbi:hypothetical protein D5086_024147, partial [Populus alba]
ETAFSLLSSSLSGPRGAVRVAVKGDGQTRAKRLGSETGKEAGGEKQGDQRPKGEVELEGKEWNLLPQWNSLSALTGFVSWAHHCRASYSPLIYSNSGDGMATKRRPHKLRSFPGHISYFLPGRTDLGPRRWLTGTHTPVICFTAV